MAGIDDRINPVTGRSYGSGFRSAPGNPGQNFGTGWQANNYYGNQSQQEDPMAGGQLNKVKKDVAAGSDFSGYQNQLNALMQNPSSIQNDPSYQFRLQGGEQAINRSAAARGMGNSGNVLAELTKYGQGMASEEYGNQFNRLNDLMRNSQRFGIETGYYKPPAKNAGWSFSNQPSWY